MKKNNNLIIGIIIAIVLLYMGNQGMFKGIFSIEPSQIPSTPYPKEIIKEYLTYNVNLDINPNDMCTGDTATGTITSNIYNGVCSVFYDDGTGYQWYSNVNLDNRGRYSESQVVTAPTLNFIAVCCDANNNCKLSNIERVTTHACDTDGDGIPDEIDDDDDNDGWTDVTEIGAGTDPKDPGSHPTYESGCSATCTSEGYLSGRGPFESGGSCSYPEVIEYLTGESGLICCCTPEAGPTICSDTDGPPTDAALKTYGVCTDETGSHPDYCADSNNVVDIYCGPTMSPPAEQTCLSTTTSNCATFGAGWSCASGKCIPPSS